MRRMYMIADKGTVQFIYNKGWLIKLLNICTVQAYTAAHTKLYLTSNYENNNNNNSTNYDYEKNNKRIGIDNSNDISKINNE